jgi:hypothetical protein
MTVDDDVARECPVCHTRVLAAFCGNCGADPVAATGFWDVLLRPRVFATAPREPVLMPRMTSTLFPRLPQSARQPFRLALVLLFVAMVVLSVLRANAPLGAIAVLGGPVLFLLYMWQSDAFTDISRRALVVALVTGAGLAVLWWLFTGRLLSGAYGVSTAAGLALQNLLAGFGLAVTIGGAAIMLVPPLVVRLLGIPVREPLDGFVIGGLGAMAYVSGATITWMFPQIVAGLLESQSAWRMFGDAIIYGVIEPLIALPLGALFGLLMWFRPAGAHARRALTAVAICAAVTALAYAAVWTVDALALPRVAEIVINLGFAVMSLLAVRCAVQIALLHGGSDSVADDPVLCVHCETVVPDMAFCVACGAAARASSRSSRQERRAFAPVPEVS